MPACAGVCRRVPAAASLLASTQVPRPGLRMLHSPSSRATSPVCDSLAWSYCPRERLTLRFILIRPLLLRLLLDRSQLRIMQTLYDTALRQAVSAARSVTYGEIVSVSCKPRAADAAGAAAGAVGAGAVVDGAAVTTVHPFSGLDGADDFEAVKATYTGFDGPGGYSQLAKVNFSVLICRHCDIDNEWRHGLMMYCCLPRLHRHLSLQMFGFIDDVKAGVPRTAYQGVTTIIHNGCRKFLVDAAKA